MEKNRKHIFISIFIWSIFIGNIKSQQNQTIPPWHIGQYQQQLQSQINTNNQYQQQFVAQIKNNKRIFPYYPTGKITEFDPQKDKVIFGNCINGYGEIEKIYEGWKISYKGLFLNGMLQGLGQLNCGGDIYTGYFIEGVLNGKFQCYFGNGDFYYGNLINSIKYGFGKMYFNDGGYYEGFFYNDFYSGYGTYKATDGSFYQGWFDSPKFRNDLSIENFISGYGTYIYRNDSIYYGFLKYGKRYGYGSLFYNLKLVKEGYWNKDLFLDGCNYDQFNLKIDAKHMDIPSPAVIGDIIYLSAPHSDSLNILYKKCMPKSLTSYCDYFMYNNQLGYMGTLLNGLPHGFGALILATRLGFVTYIGNFENGGLNGTFMVYHPSYIYIGELLNGEKTGKGKILFITKNGTCKYFYDGNFLNDNIEGEGNIFYMNGNIYTGRVTNKKQINESTEVQLPNLDFYFSKYGIMKYNSDSTYIGEWDSGERKGYGKLINNKLNSAIKKGLWENNKLIKKD